MTEDRKKELKQLLLEAQGAIRVQHIQKPTEQSPPLPRTMSEYKMLLRQDYISLNNYSMVSECVPYLIDRNIRRKIFDFLRREFAEFLDENLCMKYHTPSGDGLTNLDEILRKLLTIFLTFGVEKAIQVVGRYTKDNRARYQMIVCIDGIILNHYVPPRAYPGSRASERWTDIQVFPGVRLVTVHGSISSLPRHLRSLYAPVYDSDFINEIDFNGKVMMVIDYSISPFLLQSQANDMTQICKVNDQDFPQLSAQFNRVKPFKIRYWEDRHNWNITWFKFVEDFCSVLSLHYNCAIKPSYHFDLTPDGELYGVLSFKWTQINIANKNTNIRGGKNIEFLDVKEIKRLYSLLVNLNEDVYKKIRTSLIMWIDSYTDQHDITKIAILRHIFDVLYTTQSGTMFGKRASCFLGENNRSNSYRKLYGKFSQIMHGTASEKIISNLPNNIEKSQDICRRTIMKILEDGKFPYNN